MHCHTTNSDGVNTPAIIEAAYEGAGYDFVVVTDHDFLTPDPGVPGIQHFNGVEESTLGGHIISIWPTVNQPSTDAQTVINAILADNAVPIMAHPNYAGDHWSNTELAGLTGFAGIEVFNAVVAPNSNAENKWDVLLSARRKLIVGIAVDDCHSIAGAEFNQAWIVVFADALTAEDVKNALVTGNFYSSTGPTLSVSNSGMTISAETDSLSAITWMGEGGVILRSTPNVTIDSYEAVGSEIYIRIKVTRNSDGKNAWSNPILTGT